MPSKTFFNLPKEKKERIELLLVDNFYKTHASEVRVSQILEGTEISRTSFYKYFSGLEDAYTYTIQKIFSEIHNDILEYILKNKNQFFEGIMEYLKYCGQLDRNSKYFKGILLLINGEDASIYKHAKNPDELSYINLWVSLLKDSKIKIEDKKEALSFMYFIMDVVIENLKIFIVNDWSEEQLAEEFSYRIQWLTKGIG